MKTYLCLVLSCALAAAVSAASLEESIATEAIVVTKAELRRHMAAPDDDAWRPASYADLEASRGNQQPDYLVVRFRSLVAAHYYGEAEAKINGAKHGTKLNVVLHFNRGWVEYLIPLDGLAWPMRRDGGPSVVVVWNSLKTK